MKLIIFFRSEEEFTKKWKKIAFVEKIDGKKKKLMKQDTQRSFFLFQLGYSTIYKLCACVLNI
jgi:hypothetical protein